MIQAWLVADNSPVGTFAASGVNYQAQCADDVRLLKKCMFAHVFFIYIDSCHTHQ